VPPKRLLAALLVTLTASCGSSDGGPAPAAVEHCFPHMFGPEPRGALPSGTTEVTLRMKTDRNAFCRHSGVVEGVRFIEMENVFASTGGLEHTTPVTDLGPGAYRMFAKCEVSVDLQTDCATPHDLVFLFEIAGSGGP